MRRVVAISLIIAVFALLVFLCQKPSNLKITRSESIESGIDFKETKKILYVASYHKEYDGSIPKQIALREFTKNKNIEYKIVYFDAKRIKNPDALKEKAHVFKKLIDEWQPDVIIAMDDAASKYLIAPYYKNTEIPIVFAGVNWTAKAYGFPCKNITGQIEVELIKELFEEIAKYTKGTRIGFLSANTSTNHKTLKQYSDVFGINFEKTELVDDFESWKQSYMSMQDDVDVLFLRNYAGIKNWSESEALSVISEHTKIPTITTLSNMYHYALLSYCKLDSEMGEYAIKTALKILDGTSPADIPVSYNKNVKVYLNVDLAKKLNIIFPFELMQRVNIVHIEAESVE